MKGNTGEPRLSIKMVDGSNGTVIDGFEIELEQQVDGIWQEAVRLVTDRHGIVSIELAPPQVSYRVRVNSSAYFATLGGMPSLASMTITFWIPDTSLDYQVLVVIEGHTQFATVIREDVAARY